MGYSQGKMIKPEELQQQSLIDSKETSIQKIDLPFKENYKVISKTTKNNVQCKIIEFTTNENKQIDCEISLNKINFEEAYEMDYIFDSVLKVFENMGINFPIVIYLNIENSRINIFLKLKSIDEIIVITNKFISLIKNFNKLMKFTNDIDYKVHKKPEIQSNYSPLNSNNTYVNQFNNPNSNKNEKINILVNNDSDKKKSLLNESHGNSENKQLQSPANNFVENSAKIEENYKKFNMKNHDLDCVEDKNKSSNTKKRSLTFDSICEIEKKVNESKPDSTYISNNINNNKYIINNDSFLKSKIEKKIKEEENRLFEDKKFKLTEELITPRLRIETEAEETFLPHVLDRNFESFTDKKASKNINEEIIDNLNNNIENNLQNKFHETDIQKGDLDMDTQNQKGSPDSKKKISEYSHEELERMYFLSRNEEILEHENFIVNQQKEEVDKLLKDLLINGNSFSVADNLLLNSNFLNFDDNMIGLSFEDEENIHNGDFINLTSNNIVENTIKRKMNSADNFNLNTSYLACENKNLKENSINEKEQKLTDNPNLQQGEFENANIFELKAFKEKKEIKSEEDFDFENKFNNCNKDYMKDEKLFKKSEKLKNNQKNKKIDFSNHNFANNNQINSSSIHNNLINNINNKYMNKIKFPKIQESFNQNQYNKNNNLNNNFFNDYQNHSKLPGNILLNNTNNLDNAGMNFQRTRNYYINNILNFNPNNNSNYDNFKNQNTANINAMLNPNLINHNMLLMMKKINQNIPSNPFIQNNISHIQMNNVLANKNPTNFHNNLNNQFNLNHSNNTNLNNNIKCKSEGIYHNAHLNPTNIQINDDKSQNFFVNTGFIYTDNNESSKRDENSNLNNNNYMTKEFEDKLDYLEEKIKLISVNEDSLEGFYFKKFDYISDEEFLSFYLIGNLNNLKNFDDVNFKKNQLEYSENKEKKIEKENYFQALSKFFNETLKLKLKHIIQNPSESENIARLIFYKNKNLYTSNSNNDYNLFDEIDGLEHKKIELMNSYYMFIRIKSLVFKLHPEELYVDLQIKVTYETNNFDERDFVDYIEKSIQLEFHEISFITEGECIITFYEKEKLKHFVKMLNEKPFHQIKKHLEKNKIEAFILNEPFPIYGNKINITYEENSVKVDFSKRPPESLKVISGNYIPSLKKLMLSKNLWSSFKIEKNNFNIVNVEQFHNEISISDIEKLKIAYTDKMNEKNYRKQNIYTTIVEYNKPQIYKNENYDSFNKNKLRKIIRDDDSQNFENLNKPNEKPKQKIFSTIKTKPRKAELDSDVEFSSSENTESSFSLKNIEKSDLDLEENNSFIDNYYTSISDKSEIIRVKKRGRKRKSQSNTNNIFDNSNLNKFNLINKTRSPCLSNNYHNNNNYGKKFINSFKRSYNHSRYSVNNLELESSIDPNKPNILDELIKNDLDDQEKCLLEKLEKDVQDRIFNKNANNTNNYLPKKRGRKPRTDNHNLNTIVSSENKTILNPYLDNKVFLRNRKDSKIYKENSESDNEENKSFKQLTTNQDNKYLKEAGSEIEYDMKNGFNFGKGQLKENIYQYSNEIKNFENTKKESFEKDNDIGIADKTNSHNNSKMKEKQMDNCQDESKISHNDEDKNREDLKKNCINEEMINTILNRKNDKKIDLEL